MFTKQLKNKNPKLIEAAYQLYESGLVLPDSFLVDVDQLMANAKAMLAEANKYDIELYFMLKQLGRNPYLAKKFIELGYPGAVVVDFKEAQVMMDHNIPIINIGNLVQIPKAMLEAVLRYKVTYVTVFSSDIVERINQISEKLNQKQKLMIRVYDEKDKVYSGQEAGISLQELPDFYNAIKDLNNIEVTAVTSFPCFLFNEASLEIEALPNLETVFKAKEILENLGAKIDNINGPSATCTSLIPKLKALGVTSGEPGHGLSGTTPAHRALDLVEKPAVIYLSEVSHHFRGQSYIYGGGHYRRSHLQNAIVKSAQEETLVDVIPPNLDSIDYHFGLKGIYPIGSGVISAFRFQIFVTRSDVVLIEGISHDKPQIVGVYNSLGQLK